MKFFLLLLFSLPLFAFEHGELPEFKLRIFNHRFEPELLNVPAGVKFKLLVTNDDDTAEEFESWELNREKIIQPHKTAVIFIGPLDKGDYEFVGEFHAETAKGKLLAE